MRLLIKRFENALLVVTGIAFFGALAAVSQVEKEMADVISAMANRRGSDSSQVIYDYADTDLPDSIIAEREVNRDVFVNVLAERDKNDFIKACDKVISLTKKWKGIVDGVNEPEKSVSTESNNVEKEALKRPKAIKPNLKKPKVDKTPNVEIEEKSEEAKSPEAEKTEEDKTSEVEKPEPEPKVPVKPLKPKKIIPKKKLSKPEIPKKPVKKPMPPKKPNVKPVPKSPLPANNGRSLRKAPKNKNIL